VIPGYGRHLREIDIDGARKDQRVAEIGGGLNAWIAVAELEAAETGFNRLASDPAVAPVATPYAVFLQFNHDITPRQDWPRTLGHATQCIDWT
jgi:hypothetical protein